MEAYRQFYKDVTIVFRRKVKMRWRGIDFRWDYLGEWSVKTDRPHGRGILIGVNCVRVGYYKDGEIAHGKVLVIGTLEKGTYVYVGTEENLNGKTKFKGRVHPANGKCWTGTVIDNVKQ